MRRLAETGRAPVAFTLNGLPAAALVGDTVLTAVLTRSGHLRHNEFSGQPRAGFCLMGACQDCWVRIADGASVRACSTFVTEGLAVLTNAAEGAAP
jgi:aerobic-type carbon monoxide dehydrogenase small subunit (CoxS/CutS family)